MLLSALWQRTWGSYQVVTGILRNLLICIKESSLLSSFELELGIALKALQGKRASSRIKAGNLLSFVKLWREAWGFSQVEMGTSGNLVLTQGSQVSFCVARVSV